LTVHDALLGTKRTIALDRSYEGHDLPIAHIRIGKSGHLEIVLLGSRFGTPETYGGRWQRIRRLALTGFNLYCEREREVIRRIDEKLRLKKAVDEIKRNRFSNVRGCPH
jgi:hypothetical protein